MNNTKRFYIRAVIFVALALMLGEPAAAKWKIPKVRITREDIRRMREERMAEAFRIADEPKNDSTVRTVEQILESLPYRWPDKMSVVRVMSPLVFAGYRDIRTPDFTPDPERIWHRYTIDDACLDTVALVDAAVDSLFVGPLFPEPEPHQSLLTREEVKELFGSGIPRWLREASQLNEIGEQARYRVMISSPASIDYAYWNLPPVPRMPEEDHSFKNYVRNQWLPLPVRSMRGGMMETDKINWLHELNAGLQFSQAFISPNWYQGGSNNLTLRGNFLWRVQLNTIFHPNLLFDNSVSYKLGLTSTPQDKYHDYTISEDIFQWNLRAGVKAFERWFYSVTMQFKTQFLNNYPADSEQRKASFLSPGDLTAGIGMTYSYTSKSKKFKLNASIAPVSYNLKTCIDSDIDPANFNIKAGRKVHNEVGSSGEMTVDWAITGNINYRSRLFLFSDYHYFAGDLENTLSFAINRFLSTQIYVHLRYDSSSDVQGSSWRHWMLKEILSFGISYTFSTKC